MSKLICPKCKEAGLTWQTPNQEDLLDNGIMQCDNPRCKASFVGIGGWKEGRDFTFESAAKHESVCGKAGIPHRMKRYSRYETRCINPGCRYKI